MDKNIDMSKNIGMDTDKPVSVDSEVGKNKKKFSLTSAGISVQLQVLICLLVFVSTSVLMGTVGYFSRRNNLELTSSKLQISVEQLADSFEFYFQQITVDVDLMTKNLVLKKALQEFDFAFYDYDDPMVEFQKLYLIDNPFPVGERLNYNAADDDSLYSSTHQQFHPWFREFLSLKGLADVTLINSQGDIVYTVEKNLEYATNIENGAWSESGLRQAYKKAVELAEASGSRLGR